MPPSPVLELVSFRLIPGTDPVGTGLPVSPGFAPLMDRIDRIETLQATGVTYPDKPGTTLADWRRLTAV